MILGVVFGTLSSIFIAAPVAYLTMGRTIREEEVPAVEEKK
jgi:SecD/SecF fusion protein